MTTKFTDVAKEAAYMNSVKVQRYHGGLSNTLTAEISATDLSVRNNVIYLCPIPWYARLKDISIIFEGEAYFETQSPKVALSVRSMKDKCAKTASDLANLEYTMILATQNDHDCAIGNTTLAGIDLSPGSEIMIAQDIDPYAVRST